MHLDVPRCVDADPHLVPLPSEYGYADIVPDPDALADTAGKYQHGRLLGLKWI
jgi:hypothetical protein